MPTKLQRLMVTLDPPVARALRDLQAATGTPRSVTVRRLLLDLAPSLAALAEAASKVRTDPEAAQSSLARVVGAEVGRAVQTVLELPRTRRSRRRK
jgi:hypothetical protein